MNNMKSMKIIKALGNINDSLIEEAADPFKIGDNEGEEFQEAVMVSVPKSKIRFTAFIPFAAVLAVTFAVLILAQTIILHNSAFDLNKLLASHGVIEKVDIVSEKHFSNIDTAKVPELVDAMNKDAAKRFTEIEHQYNNERLPLDEMTEEDEYVLFFGYTDGTKVRVVLFNDAYYIEIDGESYACDGDSEGYAELVEALNDYIRLLKNDLKVSAELDGYRAEQTVEYMAFNLNVTFPDGETASYKTNLTDYGDLDHQIQKSTSPETDIFKLSYNDITEYVVMQKVSYDEDTKKVIFFFCDEENHELVIYNKPYQYEDFYDSYDYFDNYCNDKDESDDNDDIHYGDGAEYEYEIAVCPISDDFTLGEEGNVFYDIKLGNKLGFNLERHIIVPTEYLPWEQGFPDIEYSDIQEHFTAEKLNLSSTANIAGVIDGDLLYYFEYAHVPDTIYYIARIVEENMITGEKQTILEETSKDVVWYYPICVQNGYLYYIYSIGGTVRVTNGGIWKINLSDNTPEFVHFPETLYNCYTITAENGFYFYYKYNDCNEAYFLNTSDDSVTKVLDSIEELFFSYKNGIIYSIGSAVYYRGDDDLYCIETMENGDKKLFEIEKENSKWWNWHPIANGEYIAVILPYDDVFDNYSWNRTGVFMIYDDNEGLLKPLGKSYAGMTAHEDGNGLFMIGTLIFDMKKGLNFKLPYHEYEDPPEGDSYGMQVNYSDGKIYYMICRGNYMDFYHDEAEFYRLTRK